MHEAADHWHEPEDWTQKAGAGAFARPTLPYDKFMNEQEIPIVRDYGVRKVQNLPRKPWARMGGKGADKGALPLTARVCPTHGKSWYLPKL